MPPPPVSPKQRIYERQADIIGLSLVLTLFLLFLWVPILFIHEDHCRPMGQSGLTALLILLGMPILLLRGLAQIIATWPKKRIGLIAIAIALAPLVVLVLLQWLILDVRGIVYEP